jgi:hypothetical protein
MKKISTVGVEEADIATAIVEEGTEVHHSEIALSYAKKADQRK